MPVRTKRGIIYHFIYDCFYTRAKMCNLNYHSNCTIWMIIRMMIFWTVCTLHKITLQCVIWIVQFKWRIAMWFCVHTVQNTVIWMIIQIAQFQWQVKLCTFIRVWKQSKEFWASPSYRCIPGCHKKIPWIRCNTGMLVFQMFPEV